MFFTRHKGDPRPSAPVSSDFIMKATVTSMRIGELALPLGRDVCEIILYSQEPVMINGETEHEFRVIVPNHDTYPPHALNRMRFWMCYGHHQAVEFGENDEVIVPLVDQETCTYFTRRFLDFSARIIDLGGGFEVAEISYLRGNGRL